VQCHAVSGASNEMFSDFQQHVVGVPQIVPSVGNVTFDGAGQNEDFGLEQVTGNGNDRYKFRTSPLRNVSLQPAFFHNGAYTRLEDALRFHLNPAYYAPLYNPIAAGVDTDLQNPVGPIAPVLARLDPLMQNPVILSDEEFRQLVDFVRNGLTDENAKPEKLRRLIPASVPSGRPLQTFQ
jgi:cytochrome c peroxidase